MKNKHPLTAVLLVVKGLKCDRPGCGFVDPEPQLTEEYLMSNIGRPCPLCGASLLTKEDAKTTMRILANAAKFNQSQIPRLAAQARQGKPIERGATVNFKMNGTGAVDIILENEP